MWQEALVAPAVSNEAIIHRELAESHTTLRNSHLAGWQLTPNMKAPGAEITALIRPAQSSVHKIVTP